MPTYDYICDACGHEMEVFQSMNDEPLKRCPECDKKKLRRLIGTGAGIIFKGSGFYETDYKRQDKQASSGDASKQSPKKDAKTSDKPKTKADSGSK